MNFPKLDKTKPFGDVIGHSVARYFQAGIHFTGDGRPCVGDIDDLKPMDGAPGFKDPPPQQSAPPASPEVAALLSRIEAQDTRIGQLVALVEAQQAGAAAGPVPFGTAPMTPKPPAPAPQPPEIPQVPQVPAAATNGADTPPEDPDMVLYRQRLENTQFAKLKKAFKSALEQVPEADRIEMPTGPGSKDKIVAWMMANTSP